MITYFGIAAARGVVQTPSSWDALGRAVFPRPLPSNFIIVVEARPGPNDERVGQNLPSADDGTLPDLWIESNRSLGNGSTAICDTGPRPNIGGIPAVEPADFSVDGSPAVRGALIDFACRFQVHIPSEDGSRTQPGPCTVNELGNFRFASRPVTALMIQFCFEPVVGTEAAFPGGRTVLTARVRDEQGGVGDPVQIVIDVDE